MSNKNNTLEPLLIRLPKGMKEEIVKISQKIKPSRSVSSFMTSLLAWFINNSDEVCVRIMEEELEAYKDMKNN